MVSLKERIRLASGEGMADLLIKNGRVVDVFSGQIEKKDVAILGGVILGFGDYQARETIDVKGDFLCPGLIDGHVHIESSMVTIPEFARAVLPNGTTTVVIDPHEIANVLGHDLIMPQRKSCDLHRSSVDGLATVSWRDFIPAALRSIKCWKT